MAEDRLALTSSGHVRYTLKTPYRDGTTQIELEPLELVARLAALVPLPRHVAMGWARRLKRVFGIEIDTCQRCGGTLRIIASIEQPSVIATILAHHIQRLMVTGLFALLLGVRPQRVHEWYLAVYVDAVEWVQLPNTLGMSQYGDGGLMASKPYVATGKYIQRMGGSCGGCRYDPALRTGERACPFTTLYWDFLMRHEARLAANARMALQVKNVARMSAAERAAVALRADAIRQEAACPVRMASATAPTARPRPA